MKKNLFLIAILLSFLLKTQAQVFTSKINIEFNTFPEPSILVAADLNADGFNDIVGYDSENGKIYFNLYDETQSSEFQSKQLLASIQYCENMISCDLNSDGYDDILATSTTLNTVYFIKNNRDLSFDVQIIDNNLGGAFSVAAADIDWDGFTDIVAIGKTDNKVVWYRNEGDGNFSTANLISDYNQLPLFLAVADFDLDGDDDIAVAYGLSKEIIIYENQYTDFSYSYLVDEMEQIPTDLKTADFDKDQKPDLLYVYRDNGNIFLLKNQTIANFEKILVADFLPSPIKIAIGDYDLDFDQDIVVSVYQQNKLFFIKNNDLNFSDTLSMPIFEENPDPILLADFNGDNLLDIAIGIRGNDRLFWFKNGGATFYLHIIDLNSTGWSLAVEDVDNDSDNDVFYSDGSNIFAAYNNGDGTFQNPYLIINGFYNITDIKFEDLDNDGFKDMIFTDAMGDEVYFMRNNNGFFDVATMIDNTEDGPFTVKLADFDQDNDYDLLVSNINSNTIVLYENLGNFNFQKYTIATNVNAYSLDFVDVDNDNDLDIVFSEYSFIGAIFNNNGSYSTWQILNNQYGYAYNLEKTDLNNDNLDDFLINSSALVYFKKQADTFATDTIHIHWESCYNFDIADLDYDGDLDIATTTRSANEVQYVENFNNADSFSYMILSVNSPENVKIAEINNDNAKDLVIGSWADNGIYWAENYFFKIFRQPQNFYGCIGEDAFFSVLVNGAVEFQWQIFDGNNFVNLNDDEVFQGTKTALLKIKDLSEEFIGKQFRCVLTNKDGEQLISQSAELQKFQPYFVCSEDTIVRNLSENQYVYVPQNGEFDVDSLVGCPFGIYAVTNDYNFSYTLDGEDFSPGIYYINWFLFDEFNNPLDTCFKVIIINEATDVFKNQNSIKIYPNPTSDILYFKGISGIAKIEILDLLGRKILEQQLIDNQVNVSFLKEGIYQLRIKTEKQYFIQTFIKQ